MCQNCVVLFCILFAGAEGRGGDPDQLSVSHVRALAHRRKQQPASAGGGGGGGGAARPWRPDNTRTGQKKRFRNTCTPDPGASRQISNGQQLTSAPGRLQLGFTKSSLCISEHLRCDVSLSSLTFYGRPAAAPRVQSHRNTHTHPFFVVHTNGGRQSPAHWTVTLRIKDQRCPIPRLPHGISWGRDGASESWRCGGELPYPKGALCALPHKQTQGWHPAPPRFITLAANCRVSRIVQGCVGREGGGGGRGSRTQKFMYQKWPNPVFPSVNFILSHYEIWVPGGTPPPLVTVSRSNTALGAAPRCTAPSFLTGGEWVRGWQRMGPQGSWGLNPRLIQHLHQHPPSPPQSARLCNGGDCSKRGGGGYNIKDLG